MNIYIYIYISKFTVGAVLKGDARTFFKIACKKGLEWTCLTDGKISPLYNSYTFP